MTFNATSLNLERAKTAGLVVHQPLRPPTEWRRFIVCPPAIDAQLSGKDTKSGLPSLGIAPIIGRFIAGHSLVISRKRRTNFGRWSTPTIELEQLEGLPETWVLCYRRPLPGWRVAGRFVERDLLALFAAYDKRDIGNNYKPVAEFVANEWEKSFGAQPPCTGNEISTYLSGAHHNVDEADQP